MNTIKAVAKTTVIGKIRATAPRPGTTIPGNILVNDKTWISRSELRNFLIGLGLSADLPVMTFIGCRLNYEELTITQADIDAGIAAGDTGTNGKLGYVHEIAGRKIVFTKPAVNNINMSLDLSSINVTESTLNLFKASSMFPRLNAPAPAPAAAVRPVTTETIVDDPNKPAAPNLTEDDIAKQLAEELAAGENAAGEDKDLVTAGVKQGEEASDPV